MKIWAGIALIAILYAGTARGQAVGQGNLERFDRQLEQLQRETRYQANPDVPADARTLWDYGGFLTLNYLTVTGNDGNTHVLRQVDLIGYAHLNLDGVHELSFRGRATYRDFNEGDSFDGRGDRWILRVEQASYRFDLQRYLSAYKGVTTTNDLSIQVGRQYVTWANGLAFSDYLDGAVIGVKWGRWDLDFVAGVTPTYTVDFDTSRPSFDTHTTRGYYGAMLSTRVGKHRPFVYGLIERDYNPDETLTIGFINTRFNYDAYYVGIGSNGSLSDHVLYGVEAVYESGKGLSNSFSTSGQFQFVPIDQTEEHIQSFAFDARLDYVMGDIHRTQYGVELIGAGGDSDRIATNTTFGGNKAGSADHAFNGLGLLNTGLAFAPEISNLLALRASASTFPATGSDKFRNMQVGMDVYVFSKFLANAPISEATTDKHFLGWEPDVYINWQISSDVALTTRYGVFFPSDSLVSGTQARHFFFIAMSFGL